MWLNSNDRFRRSNVAKMSVAVSLVGCLLLTAANVSSAAQARPAITPRVAINHSVGNPKINQEVRGCPTKLGTLTVALDETFPATIDPSYSNFAVVYRIDRGVFDSLVYEGSNKTFSPWLATKWTVNRTATSYTFTIRKGVKFSDGTALTASAVKYTFDRIESPAEQSLFAIGLLGPYQNSVVNGPYSVTVNFTKQYPAFLEAASQAFLGIVSPTAVQKLGASFGELPVGSGPFIITANEPNLAVNEVRNPNYTWGPADLPHHGPACLAGIDFNEVPTSTTRSGELLSGAVDAAETILPPDYQSMRTAGNVLLYVVPGAGYDYQISINTAASPWNVTNMRIALRDAIDIPSTLRAVYSGEYTRAWGPLMPNTAFYNPAVKNTWKYDPRYSDKLLNKQGWKMGLDGYRHKDGQTLTLTFAGSSPDRELRQEVLIYVQQYLKTVGINMVITNYAGGPYRIALENSASYDATGSSTITASPVVLNQRFAGDQIPSPSYPGGANVTRFVNPTFDQWLAIATASSAPKIEQKYWGLVQMFLVQKAITIPIELEPFILATLKTVHGLTFDVRDYPMYYGVWLAK